MAQGAAIWPRPGRRPPLIQWLTVSRAVLRAGDRVGPYDLPLSPALVRKFAEATHDTSAPLRGGSLVPPNLLATQIYRAQFAAMAELVPDEVFSAARSGVHGQHDLLLHRPVTADEHLRTFVETHSARPSRDNLRVTLHHTTLDDDDSPVAEQWWTTVLLGTTAEPTGPDLPDYSFSSAGTVPVAEDAVTVDEVMAHRYAAVSGDHSDHHFSIEGARRSGFDAPFVHGLCTMALCTPVAIMTVGGGDPRRIRRVAVRLAAPAFLGQDLRVGLFERPDGRFALEASCGADAVVRNGLVELVG
jgi:acyl dehydratase